MSCLHSVSRSPSHRLVDTCASLLRPGDAIIFIEDGCFHCLQVSLIKQVDIKLYYLEADMQARGLGASNINGAKSEIVDYDRFVDLCCEHDKLVNWF